MAQCHIDKTIVAIVAGLWVWKILEQQEEKPDCSAATWDGGT